MKISRLSAARLLVRTLEAGLLLVLPLVFHRGFAEQFSYPKLYLTQILIIIALAAWALGIVWEKLSWPPHFRLGAPLALLALAVLLSSKNSPVPLFSLHEAMYFLCGPVWVLLLVSWGQGEGTAARLGVFGALAGTVVTAITLMQWAGYDPLLFGGYRIEWGKMVTRMRLYATFGNPNFVAGYLIGAIFLALALGGCAARAWAKAAWWTSAAAMLAAILGTGSHGAWGGLVAGLCVAGFVWKRRLNHAAMAVAESVEKGRPGAAVRSFLVAPALISLGSLFAGSVIERLLAQMAGRTYLWRFSWPMFAEHPLIGSGWGTYQLRYLELQARFLAAHPEWIPHWTNNRLLHNDPLQLLLETGALGLVALGWVLWTYGREARSVLGAAGSPTARWWLGASAGGVTAILVDSFFNFQVAIPPTFVLLFTLLAFPAVLTVVPAVAAAPEVIGDRRGISPRPPDRVNPERPCAARVMRLLASLAILICAGALLVERTCLAWAERDYLAGTLLENRGDVMGAEEKYRHGLALNPLNGRLHFALARLLYSCERYPDALGETLLAERTYVDSHIEVLKGHIHERMGMTRPALETFRHAMALDPTLKSVPAVIERLQRELSSETTERNP
jgi:O-antigen ligase